MSRALARLQHLASTETLEQVIEALDDLAPLLADALRPARKPNATQLRLQASARDLATASLTVAVRAVDEGPGLTDEQAWLIADAQGRHGWLLGSGAGLPLVAEHLLTGRGPDPVTQLGRLIGRVGLPALLTASFLRTSIRDVLRGPGCATLLELADAKNLTDEQAEQLGHRLAALTTRQLHTVHALAPGWTGSVPALLETALHLAQTPGAPLGP